jgi:hypothetical protein
MYQNQQKTLDDIESVLEPSGREHIIDHTQVEPRPLEALRVFDRMQQQTDVDPMEYSYDDAMDMFLGRDKYVA